MQYGLLLVHSVIDFDMSFFYIKLVAFILIGLLSSYYRAEKLQKSKRLQITMTSIVILFCIGSLYGNTTLLVAKEITNYKNEAQNFTLANKLAPYSLEIKEKELAFLLNNKKDVHRKIELCNEILKNEKAYDKIILYKEMCQYAILQLSDNRYDEASIILQQASILLEERNNNFPLRIENYMQNVWEILEIIEQLEIWNENEDVKEFIEDSLKQANLIIEEATRNVANYKVTTMSEQDFEEIKRNFKSI